MTLNMTDHTAPLILSYHSDDDQDNYVPAERISATRSSRCTELIDETVQLFKIALPMILTGLLVYSKSVISVLFLGRLGREALAGGSLSMGLANISGYSVITGIASGMEAIISQAYGAQQWTLVSRTLQRIIVILLLSCMPISMIWLNAETILLLLHQDPVISSFSYTYLTFSLPDLFLLSFISPIRNYLRAQKITTPIMVSSAIALLFHAPFNLILVNFFDLGVKGVAMAGVLTDLALLGALLIYIKDCNTCKRSWTGWSTDCFTGWKSILRLAIPNCITVCLEWWWYETMILLAGFLDNSADTVATMGIMIQMTALVYIFPSSLSQAVSTRVGNELGAGQPGNARTASMVALSCAAIFSIFALVFMLLLRSIWGKFFTSDQTILSLTTATMSIGAFCELGNFPQTTGCGVLKGSARPYLAATINAVSFYVVGLPIAALASFKMGRGFPGLWYGLLSAQIVSASAMLVVVLRTDWELQKNRARELTSTAEDQHVLA